MNIISLTTVISKAGFYIQFVSLSPFSLPLVGGWGLIESICHSVYYCSALNGDILPSVRTAECHEISTVFEEKSVLASTEFAAGTVHVTVTAVVIRAINCFHSALGAEYATRVRKDGEGMFPRAKSSYCIQQSLDPDGFWYHWSTSTNDFCRNHFELHCQR